MNTLGAMPIPVVLRRDQVRTIRGLVNAEMERTNYRPAYLVGLLEILDNADVVGAARVEKPTVRKPQRCQAWCSQHPDCQHDWSTWARPL